MAITENRVDVKQTTAGSGPDGGTMFRICQSKFLSLGESATVIVP
jgi:hypothetical protein